MINFTKHEFVSSKTQLCGDIRFADIQFEDEHQCTEFTQQFTKELETLMAKYNVAKIDIAWDGIQLKNTFYKKSN